MTIKKTEAIGNGALDSHCPTGPLQDRWKQHKFEMKLINPSNRRKHKILVVGSGLAGSSAAATLAEQGYDVEVITFHDSPRRAHSIAAQGGINSAKNYANDGDSIYRLFYDTIKGGDYRSRESNVYRLAEVSVNIIDQCVAQGVPFAREYGGLLSNRSFGGAQLSRTFYAAGQTGQQLLLGAYSVLMRQVGLGQVKLHTKRDMLDLVVSNGKARGVVCRNMVTGELETFLGDAVLLCTGGYGNVYYLSTNAKACNATAIWRAHKRGAYFANPCFTQIHPTCIPVSGDHQSKLTLMSESLRNDGRVWVPVAKNDNRLAKDIPLSERDYFLERLYPSFGNLVPRDVASRNAKKVCDEGRGVGNSGRAVYLDFSDAIARVGEDKIREKYGNLFQMYEKITGENPYQRPMRIYPAVHYTMGGLWVDYNLMSNLPGLFVMGEANYSDHGANRLGASALMQGLADGYFVIPNTLANYLASVKLEKISLEDAAAESTTKEVSERIEKLLNIRGSKSVDYFHKKLGHIMWDDCGMARNEAGLKRALVEIPKVREEFWRDLALPGEGKGIHQELEKAARVADLLELGELMCRDALYRTESCGGHFREESQTPENEALRDDDKFSHVAAWEYSGNLAEPTLHKEELNFEFAHPSQRSYK